MTSKIHALADRMCAVVTLTVSAGDNPHLRSLLQAHRRTHSGGIPPCCGEGVLPRLDPCTAASDERSHTPSRSDPTRSRTARPRDPLLADLLPLTGGLYRDRNAVELSFNRLK